MASDLKINEMTTGGGYGTQCEECGKIYDNALSKGVHMNSVTTLLGTHDSYMTVCPECFSWLNNRDSEKTKEYNMRFHNGT